VKSTGGERTLYRSDWAYIERTADGLGRQSWARKTRTGKLFDSMLADLQSLREAAKPGLIALMSEMSEDRWCAGWCGDLGKSLIAGEGGLYPNASADYQPPDQGDFDRLVLALGEVPEWGDCVYQWIPLTAVERAMVEKRLKEAENA
jgi:hypothetical protein